jgi:hypothetical protein
MKIGKISYSDKLGKLKLANFKRYWDNRERVRTGISSEEAAKMFGIKVPGKRKGKK